MTEKNLQVVDRHEGAAETRDAAQRRMTARNRRDLLVREQAADLGQANCEGLRVDTDRKKVFLQCSVETDRLRKGVIEGQPKLGGSSGDAGQGCVHDRTPHSLREVSQSAIKASRPNPPPNNNSREASSR